MKIKIFRQNKDIALPEYANKGSAGMDLRANESMVLPTGEVRKISTGLFIEIPEGYEGQIRCRSGLATQGIILANGNGTLDSSYRGEIGVLLYNSTLDKFKIQKGDRIAQLIIAPVVHAELEEVQHYEDLSITDRGQGGFGSTGVK